MKSAMRDSIDAVADAVRAEAIDCDFHRGGTLAFARSLVQLDRVPAWIAAVIIGREMAVTALRSVLQSRGVSMPASSLGKLKMAAQVTAILGLILSPSVPFPLDWVGTVALWVVLALAIWSAVDYYRRFSDVLRGE